MLEVFTSIPGRHIVHAATSDSCAPLICRGQVAVVESDGSKGWYPTDGGLFLIEYVSPPHPAGRALERRSREIVQTRPSPKADGTWWAHPYCHRGRSGVFFGSDGPYIDEFHLAEKLLGPVVGIYQPLPIGSGRAR